MKFPLTIELNSAYCSTIFREVH